MSEQTIWTLEELAGADLTDACARVLPRFRDVVGERLGIPLFDRVEDVPADARTLVVVGGGTLIDETKLWRRHQRPGLRLIAVPSLWGSGAEASPIVALSREGEKLIEMDAALRPDVRVVWPELAEDLPLWRARDACGDVWAHALEGFFSPLADDALRGEIAHLLGELLELPLAVDVRWFDAGARACAAQARSSVGLVHGIAHTLEGALAGVDPGRPHGHARLCALYLWPVLALDRSISSKLDELAAGHGLDLDRIEGVARQLFDERAYTAALPALQTRWRDVLRDRCTRTNGALVRPTHLSWFTERSFA